ncbi:MAG: hypothetical protein K2J70_03365, partial [Muribaculaceae bacterium]|nr:hypothetical protein [Muribaculaceae bacterium]
PKKIIGHLGRRYGGKTFQKIRKGYYDFIKGCKDTIGTAFVLFHRNAPYSLDREIDEKFYHDNPEEITKQGVILILDGAIYHGGLTDRIRGILTAYRECKQRGLPFYISWTSPFPLTDYLLPATFDWRIEEREVSRSRRNARAVAIDDMTDFHALLRLKAALFSPPAQLHLYTNADSARGEYSALYRELFRPTKLVSEAVEKHKKALGKNYVAVTTRFLTLLGDFEDCTDTVLHAAAQKELMEKVAQEIRKVTAGIPESYGILVTSDSVKFLDFITRSYPRVYIVEGNVTHIDRSRHQDADSRLKTFVDQYLIMGAERVIRMRTGGMYPSGFARFGAEVGGAVFIDHIF